MSLTIKKIAEEFSRHNFENTYPYLLDNIQWNLIGEKQLEGKETIINTCEQSAKYLTGVTTKFIKFKTVLSDKCVVIDSLAEYIDKENNKSTIISSCDIYEFKDDKLSEITSYCIELNKESSNS